MAVNRDCCNYGVTHTQMSVIKTFLQLVISEFQTQYYSQYTHLNVNLDQTGWGMSVVTLVLICWRGFKMFSTNFFNGSKNNRRKEIKPTTRHC